MATWPRWAVTVGEDRSGVLLVRVWLEDGADSFRARLTTPGAGGDTGPGTGLTIALVSSPDAVAQAVRGWLGAFLRREAGRDHPPSASGPSGPSEPGTRGGGP